MKSFFILIFWLSISITNSFSQINNANAYEKHPLLFKVLESHYQPGKYTVGDVDSLGFTSYNGGQMPAKMPAQNRMITLRSIFYLDSTVINEDFVLISPPLNYVCFIYLNGNLVAKRGNIIKGYTSRLHETEAIWMPSDHLKFSTSIANEISIELYPKYGENYPLGDIYITNRDKGKSYTFWRNFFSVSFTKAMVLGAFIIGLYFIIFYFSRKSLRTSYYIPFGLVGLLYVFSYINNVISYDFAHTLALEKVSRAGLYLLSFFTVYYLLEFTKAIKNKKYVLVFFAILTFSLILMNILKENVTNVLSFYSKYGGPLSILSDIFCVWVGVLYYKQKRSGRSMLIMIGFILNFIAVLHDVYYFIIAQEKPYLMFIPYMLFILILIFFFIIASEQSDIYKTTKQQAKELKQLNENLENIVKQRTSELRSSEKQLSLLFDNMHNAFLYGNIITNHLGQPSDLEIVMVNKNFLELIGKTKQETVGQPLSNLMLIPDFEKILDICRFGISEVPYINDFYSKQLLRYFEINAYSPEKGLVALCLEDTTEHLKAVEELAKSEEKYRFLTENINDVIWIFDATEGKLTYMSPAVQKMRGFTPLKALQQPLDEAFTPDSLKKIMEDMEVQIPKFLENPGYDTHYIGEFDQPHKDGHIVHTEMVRSYRLNPKNQHIEVFGVSRDITIRKQQTRIIEDERRQFLSLLNDITEPIYVCDSETCEILFANEAKHKKFGNDIIGKKCYAALHSLNEPCKFCRKPELETIGDKVCYWDEYNPIVQRHFYHIDKNILWHNGRKAKFQISFDLTDLKNTEKSLYELNATKDKFFSIIAHDLRNPFNAILGFSDILIESIEKKRTNKIKKSAEIIKKSTQNVNKLLENLLLWARSQTGTIEFKPEIMPVKYIFSEVFAEIDGIAQKKQIKVSYETDENTQIYADKNMIATVLRNLVTNAIKYTPRGGSVSLSSIQSVKNVQISVTDNGISINKENCKKLFNTNVIIGNPGTEGESGTGLGLVLCKEFVEKHNGSIWVDSELGKGSTFSISLPFNTEVEG